jgi:Ca-activated chloride channel homolog
MKPGVNRNTEGKQPDGGKFCRPDPIAPRSRWMSPAMAAVSTAIVTLWIHSGQLWADSAASLNKKGNQQYDKKQYVEAEKAYLDAQLEAPGKPELLYNLGNTLIQQKKYDQAVQSLKQAAAKGDKGLQSSSWYNMGNSLFDSSKFKEAAEAYIQALKINPSDRDAKHNLELAWKRLQENQQQSKGKDQNQRDDKNKKPDKDQGGNDKQEDKNKDRDGNSQGDKQQGQPQQPPQGSPGKEEKMSRDQALQLLDAMKNQELNEQRKLLERQARQVRGGKDW